MWEPHSRGAFDAAGRRWPRPDLRAGDDDRQRVVAELQRHYVDGRLTTDELSERVAQATRARTFGELSALLADLPPLPEGADQAQLGAPTHVLGFPLSAVLMLVGVALVVWLIVAGPLHMGVLPFWPLFIWGFFFIGRPGRRYH
jgi:hypothetical protein